MLGVLFLISMYLFVLVRGCYIAYVANDMFSRLLAGSIILTFFFYVFVNMAMVSGLLPVIGLPLPLMSRGGDFGRHAFYRIRSVNVDSNPRV